MTAETPAEFWDLIESFDTAMVATRDGERLRARPMAPKIDRERHLVLFITDRNSHKVDEIERDPQVALSFTKHKEYLSVSGTARVSTDRALIDAAWDKEAEAWMPEGKDGPNVAVLAVSPSKGEVWDVTGNSVKQAWEFAKALAGDKDRPDTTGHAEVRL